MDQPIQQIDDKNVPQERNPHMGLIVIVVFLVLIGGYFAFFGGTEEEGNKWVNFTPVNLSEAQSGDERLPEGFSAGDLAIEKENVVESYTVHGESGTQYTVVYLSSESIDAKLQTYLAYIEESVFELEISEKGKNFASIRAATSLEEILIIITPEEELTRVSITYLKRDVVEEEAEAQELEE